MIKTSAFLITMVLILSSTIFAEQKERRVALILSNSESFQSLQKRYGQRSDLISVHKHSANVSLTLSKLGFTVQDVISPDQDKLKSHIKKFLSQLKSSDIAVIYFSGHIAQISGRNYLIPATTSSLHMKDIEFQAVALDPFLHEMKRSKGKKFLFLNACSWQSRSTKNSQNCKGLTPITSFKNMVIAYANEPERIAPNPEEQEGLFATALIDNLSREDASLQQIMRKVRNDVAFETHSRQLPWVDNHMGQNFVFNPKTKEPTRKTSSSQPKLVSWQSDHFPKADEGVRRQRVAFDTKKESPSLYKNIFSGHHISGHHIRLTEVKADLPYPVTEFPENLSRKTIIRLLQKHLADMNCYSGSIDSRWGDSSKAALVRFEKNLDMDLSAFEEPDLKLLKLVAHHSGPVCGTPCSSETAFSAERLTSHSLTRHGLTRKGECIAIKRPPQSVFAQKMPVQHLPQTEDNKINVIKASLSPDLTSDLTFVKTGQNPQITAHMLVKQMTNEKSDRRMYKRKKSFKLAQKKKKNDKTAYTRKIHRPDLKFQNLWGI